MASTLTAEQRTLRARVAALTRWGRTPPDARAEALRPAADASLRPWLDEVAAEFPDLAEVDRIRLAQARQGANLARLSLAASRGAPPEGTTR